MQETCQHIKLSVSILASDLVQLENISISEQLVLTFVTSSLCAFWDFTPAEGYSGPLTKTDLSAPALGHQQQWQVGKSRVES